MVGRDHVFSGTRAEFRAPVWEVLGKHRYGVYTVTSPEASGVLVPAGQGDRWLFGFESDRPTDPVSEQTVADIRRRIAAATGLAMDDIRIGRIGAYYRDECFAILLSVDETFQADRDISKGVSVLLRFGLKYLGDFGG